MDVALTPSPDGLNITYKNGDAVLDSGIASAIYLSLFGGNEDDTGVDDDPNQWWGNFITLNDSGKLRSRFQNAAKAYPARPANLGRLQDAAILDLQWIAGDDGFADSFTVECTIPAINRVLVVVSVSISSQTYAFEFPANW